MSLLHRWSLPSRGFIRDRSQDEKTSDRIKFPTNNMGHPVHRRRANISSAFSTLFEKPNNRPTIRDPEDHGQPVAHPPSSVHSRENVPPDPNSKYSHAHKYQDATPVKIISPQLLSELEYDSYPMPGALSQVTHQVNETPKTRSFRLSSTGPNKMEPNAQESTRPTSSCERVRSISSSYPSEGIRSTVAEVRSPEPATTRLANYFTDYRRYGRYPSQSTEQLSTNEASPDATFEERIQAALDPGDASSSAVAGQSSCPETLPYVDPPKYDAESSQLDGTRSRYASTITPGEEQRQKPSATSETTALANEDALSSQLGNAYQLEARIARSTDRLRQSVDTDRSVLTAVRHASVSDGDGDWSTIRDVGQKRLSRPASWMQLFTSTTAHVPTHTLAQRIQTLRLQKWVKRVCFKAKARFELVGKPIPQSRRLGVHRRKLRRGEVPEPEEEEEEDSGW
ncbi:hypothetical protein FHL15_011290 [Xylaria flabelliformis]|uniref:Uncharacterized protein n=1 Tax=Xylaria flabelliformis TaxID=2512241 RepID=A0A553HIM5_9PEZI|nr:hypothetical protein FHL15_011290 [Xylaria flabelliformis]